MKRFFALTIVFAGLFAVGQFAFAGTERYSAKEVAPAPVPECDWNGWYIGLHFGGGNAAVDFVALDDLNEVATTVDAGGVFGGFQLGYNRQINQWLVLGWEISGAWSGLDDTRHILFPDSDFELQSYHAENDFTGLLGVRAGFTGMNNHALFYVKGGAAITHWNYDYVINESLSVGARPEFDRWSEDNVAVSPFFGVGLEYMFNCHWSVKAEYNHIFIYDQAVQGTLHEDFERNDGAFGYRFDIRHDTAQLGVNYHF
jgi:outer membrane immunogenic protein